MKKPNVICYVCGKITTGKNHGKKGDGITFYPRHHWQETKTAEGYLIPCPGNKIQAEIVDKLN